MDKNIDVTISDNTEDNDFEYGELELTKPEQWERVNELLLILTTIMIFNVTSLFTAIFALTWTKEGEVLTKVHYKYTQETIGNVILLVLIFDVCNQLTQRFYYEKYRISTIASGFDSHGWHHQILSCGW